MNKLDSHRELTAKVERSFALLDQAELYASSLEKRLCAAEDEGDAGAVLVLRSYESAALSALEDAKREVWDAMLDFYNGHKEGRT